MKLTAEEGTFALTQEQGEQLMLLYLTDKPEGDSEERIIKACTLFDEMLVSARVDLSLLESVFEGDMSFSLSEEEDELVFQITPKGIDTVEKLLIRAANPEAVDATFMRGRE